MSFDTSLRYANLGMLLAHIGAIVALDVYIFSFVSKSVFSGQLVKSIIISVVTGDLVLALYPLTLGAVFASVDGFSLPCPVLQCAEVYQEYALSIIYPVGCVFWRLVSDRGYISLVKSIAYGLVPWLVAIVVIAPLVLIQAQHKEGNCGSLFVFPNSSVPNTNLNFTPKRLLIIQVVCLLVPSTLAFFYCQFLAKYNTKLYMLIVSLYLFTSIFQFVVHNFLDPALKKQTTLIILQTSTFWLINFRSLVVGGIWVFTLCGWYRSPVKITNYRLYTDGTPPISPMFSSSDYEAELRLSRNYPAEFLFCQESWHNIVGVLIKENLELASKNETDSENLGEGPILLCDCV